MEAIIFAQLIAHLAKVHAVDHLTRNVVAFGAIDNVLERGRTLHRCSHGEEIVFADENDRELEEPREIQRLVKATLIDRAIAEKAKRNPVFVPIFRGESQPDGERNMRADNGVPAIHVMFLVEKMHRTAEPARAAGRLAKKFRHAGISASAASQRMRMIAIRGDEVIIGPSGRDAPQPRPLPVRCKGDRSRRFSALDTAGSRAPRNGG